MSITLTSEQEQLVQNLLTTGRYHKSEDVIQAALNLLEEYGVQYEQWVNETQEKIEVGLQELERGEGIELDVVMKQLRDKIQNARKQTP
ncbi:MAG: type II toxin-antitoxin system ParD family antitoxin [Thermosynechococcaceae cyanobacterium MS004]|nr:type II toxin-antitoxin system ParD family antitoxin [Thermosynechococcaceae cyanobacterium MS004]